MIGLKMPSFCSELETTPEKLVKNLNAADVKTFFDWLEESHKTSIKTASALNDYWRLLKTFYVELTGHGMDEGMRSDCLNVGSLHPLLFLACMAKSAKAN